MGVAGIDGPGVAREFPPAYFPQASNFKSGKLGTSEMARPERFELPAPRFVVWCSIQLSYGRFDRHRQ